MKTFISTKSELSKYDVSRCESYFVYHGDRPKLDIQYGKLGLFREVFIPASSDLLYEENLILQIRTGNDHIGFVTSIHADDQYFEFLNSSLKSIIKRVRS